MSNPAITSQPGAGSYGTNVQTGEWSTGLCSCCSDMLVLIGYGVHFISRNEVLCRIVSSMSDIVSVRLTCTNSPSCIMCCPLVVDCYTANKYGENCCLALVPGGMAAMRTHMRLTYGIQGTVCNDALMTCCCGIFEVCRMAREIRIRHGEVSQ